MATTSAPIAQGKKYEPLHPMFYGNLRRECIKAVEGKPVKRREDIWSDPTFTQAYGLINGVAYFSETGVLARIFADSYRRDVEALHKELMTRWQNSDENDQRLLVILEKLAELRFSGTYDCT